MTCTGMDRQIDRDKQTRIQRQTDKLGLGLLADEGCEIGCDDGCELGSELGCEDGEIDGC